MSSCKQQVSVETWGEDRRDEGVSKPPPPPSSSTFLTSPRNICCQIANQKGGMGGIRGAGLPSSVLCIPGFPFFFWLPPFSPFSIAKYLAFLRKFPLFLPFPIILELPNPALSFPPPVTLFNPGYHLTVLPHCSQALPQAKEGNMGLFQKCLYTFCCPSKILRKHCFQFLLG